MQIDAVAVAKFHHAVYLYFYYYHDLKAQLTDACVTLSDDTAELPCVLDHIAAHDNGAREVAVQFLFSGDAFPDSARVTLSFGRDRHVIPLEDFLASARSKRKPDIFGAFVARVEALRRTNGVVRVLDIGGRARSGILRRRDYPHWDITVLDIVAGEGVDVVCDAHEMSAHLGCGKFDAVMSTSVFEHLLMPWKAAVEVCRVLRHGGIGAVHSHQTIGMHDLPWDFWRFSDTAWHALFNRATGLRVIDTQLEEFMHVVPRVWEERHRLAERSGGYETCSVLFEKAGEPSVDWPVRLADVVDTNYPTHLALP